MIAAVLIGRKGSKGFPKKNTYKVLGRPLADYPMQAAKSCPEIDRVYLSTDDQKLIDLARKRQIEIIRRPARLCTDRALGEDVFAHAYKFISRNNKGRSIDLLVLLMCNAATIKAETISEGIKVLMKDSKIDSAVTVSKYNMWSPLRARRIDRQGLLKPFVDFKTFGNPKTLNCDRDSQGDVWFADMGVSIIRPRCIRNLEEGLLPQKWMGRKIYPLKQWGGLDIDYPWQMPQVEHWLKSNAVEDIK